MNIFGTMHVILLIFVVSTSISCSSDIESKAGTLEGAQKNEAGGTNRQLMRESKSPFRFSALETGSSDDAAKAIVELVPDGYALLEYHADLVQTARLAQGEMNSKILRAACPPYHRWRTRTQLTSVSRRLAILQWMGQKVWELPRGPEKDKAAETLVAVVDEFIDAKLIDTLPGLDLASRAVMSFVARNESAGAAYYICPGVSVRPVVNLLTKHAHDKDDKVRDYIRDTLLVTGMLSSQSDISFKELYEILKQHFPEEHYPDPSMPQRLFFNPNQNHPPAMRWDDYEKLPTLSDEEMLKGFKENFCGSRMKGNFCSVAGDFLFSEFNSRSQSLESLLASAADDGIFKLSLLLQGLWRGSAKPTIYQENAALFDFILAYYGTKIEARDTTFLPEAIQCCQVIIEDMDKQKDLLPAETAPMEERVVDFLYRAWPLWEKATQEDPAGYSGPSPLALLSEHVGGLLPQAKSHAKQRADEILREGVSQDLLSPQARKRAVEELETIKSIP